jgi:hypothetical protein
MKEFATIAARSMRPSFAQLPVPCAIVRRGRMLAAILGPGRPTSGRTAVSLLDPIHTSELIRDMEALRAR